MKTYTCINCGDESPRTCQKKNMFCSNKCFGEHKFKETINRFLLGDVSERPTLRKVLSSLNGYTCSCCNISEWQEKPIVLQVDHIDGNAGNNMPSNLRLICPNCHSQTATFGGGNKGNGRRSRGLCLK